VQGPELLLPGLPELLLPEPQALQGLLLPEPQALQPREPVRVLPACCNLLPQGTKKPRKAR